MVITALHNMRTNLHIYHFNLNDPKQREPYVQLTAKLKATPGRGRWHNVIGGKKVGAGKVTLYPEHLYDNQWNSDLGRVFDWYEEVDINDRLIKTGHYLDITQEMIDIRNNTLTCGYTGMQFPIGSPEFNTSDKALSSPYLKEDELRLLRLVPVSAEWTATRKELSEEERAFLMPLYIKAQSKRREADIEAEIVRLNSEHDRKAKINEIERDGMIWILKRGINTNNCIFYTHTKTFSFGWRSPMPQSAAAEIHKLMQGFPFSYEIQTSK